MSEAELIALAALVNVEAAGMLAENQSCAVRNEYPTARTGNGYGYPPATSKLYEELQIRGIL